MAYAIESSKRKFHSILESISSNASPLSAPKQKKQRRHDVASQDERSSKRLRPSDSLVASITASSPRHPLLALQLSASTQNQARPQSLPSSFPSPPRPASSRSRAPASPSPPAALDPLFASPRPSLPPSSPLPSAVVSSSVAVVKSSPPTVAATTAAAAATTTTTTSTTTSPRADIEEDDMLGPIFAFAPASRELYLCRMGSFHSRPLSWRSKPVGLESFRWAAAGWILSRPETVECITCHRRVVVDLPEGDGEDEDGNADAVTEGLVQSYQKWMVEKHDETCPWKLRQCDESLLRIPVNYSEAPLVQLIERFITHASRADQFPSAAPVPKLVATVLFPAFKAIVPHLVSSPVALAKLQHVDAAVPLPVLHQCLVLALTNWTAKTREGTDFIGCDTCGARVGTWSWPALKIGFSEEMNDAVPAVVAIRAHRYWCPAVCGATQNACRPPNADGQSPAAWKALALHVMRQYLRGLLKEAATSSVRRLEEMDTYEGTLGVLKTWLYGGNGEPTAEDFKRAVGEGESVLGKDDDAMVIDGGEKEKEHTSATGTDAAATINTTTSITSTTTTLPAADAASITTTTDEKARAQSLRWKTLKEAFRVKKTPRSIQGGRSGDGDGAGAGAGAGGALA